MIAVIVALLVVIYSVFIPLTKWYWKRTAFARAIDKLPGAKAYPFIGTTYEFFGVDGKDLFKVFQNVPKINPHIVRRWMGLIPEVTIMKAEYVEAVINARKNLDKSFSYDYVKVWLGEGLLASTGDKWHKHRKIITPTFHFSILESSCEIFAENSKILVERLSHHAGTGAPINIHTFVTRAALDIISESAMGIQIDCQTQHQNEYVDAVYEISELILYRILRPYLAADIIYRNTSSGKKFKKCLDILHSFPKEVISDRKAVREENKRKGVYPSVPFVGRVLSEDIQLDQYTIPKGTTITIPIYFLHRDPRFFPDPEKFDPDRFLPENTVSRHPYAYLPFSAGPRNCVGQKFAMYEEKSVLSSIVRNYKIISIEKTDEIDLMSELILRAHNGINVKLERRRA